MEKRLGIYFAGFNHPNKTTSEKVPSKKEIFKTFYDETLIYNFEDWRDGIQNIEDEISSNTATNKYIVGFSLGAISGLYIALKFDLPIMLINPSYFPEVTLKQYLNESELKTIKVLKQYIQENYYKKRTKSNYMIYSSDDEILNYDKFILYFGKGLRRINKVEGGGHSFTKFEEEKRNITMTLMLDELEIDEIFMYFYEENILYGDDE